jgi:uncharacterized protein (DUF983 family)
METSDKSILKRYKKAHNPSELDGMYKNCTHCGNGKLRRHGRYWGKCDFCGNK